jgi:hypothetical protein
VRWPGRRIAKALLGNAYIDRGLVFPDAFGGHLKPDTVSGQIAEAKRRAGWPDGVHGLHGLRHKFASLLAHSGQISVKDIAHALGHADEAFTLRVCVKRKTEAPRTAHLFSKRRSLGSNCRCLKARSGPPTRDNRRGEQNADRPRLLAPARRVRKQRRLRDVPALVP